MSELIFIRHGQASFGSESYDKLSDHGIEQVKLLSSHWQKLGETFDHIYCGSLLRQRETAAQLLSRVNGSPSTPVIHEGFNEYNGDPLIRIYLRDFGAADGVEFQRLSQLKEAKAFQRIFEAATAKWIAGELVPQESDTGFELWQDFQSRVKTAIEKLMDDHQSGSRVLISTSGGVIALALQYALGFPDTQVIATNWMVHNSSVTKIRYGNGKTSLTLFNNLAHLEHPDLIHMVTFR
jgi:broad specificity phosphatase PhoE